MTANILMVLASVALFLYALERFSDQLHSMGEDRLRTALATFASNRYNGFLLGALFTATVQSSSAVSAITVALVDASVLSFRQSLAILLGANVGTTSTAWLASFKIVGLGPALFTFGLVATYATKKYRGIAKSILYFGLIFLALDLISQSLGPIKKDPRILDFLASANEPIIGILMGIAVTALVQSSSVVTSLVVILASQGALDPASAIAIIIGANVGTTVTGLLASIPLGALSKRTAVYNLLFNTVGALVILPFIPQFTVFVQGLADEPAITVALAHLIFNVGMTLAFLPLLGYISKHTFNHEHIHLVTDNDAHLEEIKTA